MAGGIGLRSPGRRFCKALSSPLLSPRDFRTYYTVLTHTLCTRAWGLGPSLTCRLCGGAVERLSHLPHCPEILAVFDRFRRLASSMGVHVQSTPTLILLGLTGGEALPSALSVLHVLLWKFIIISFTRVDMHGERFEPKEIYRAALLRLDTRLKAYAERVRRRALARRAKGLTPLTQSAYEHHTRVLHPCYVINLESALVTPTDKYRAALAQVLQFRGGGPPDLGHPPRVHPSGRRRR
jgi:hypothetical protein